MHNIVQLLDMPITDLLNLAQQLGIAYNDSTSREYLAAQIIEKEGQQNTPLALALCRTKAQRLPQS